MGIAKLILFEEFGDRQRASVAVAQRLAFGLEQQLSMEGSALLAVSGGTTPVACLDELSIADLPWHQVIVTVTDERCVPPEHEDRNEQMVRQRLLRNKAAAAQFVPPEAAPELCFAAVMLGMGTDGHFASLFPDAANLAGALDPDSLASAVPIDTAASPHGRISLTLSRLLNTHCLTLLIFGDTKRRVIEAASREVSLQLPISHVLNQNHVPVHIFWAE